MANTLLTIDEITRESLRVLHGSCAFIRGVNREYDSSFAKTGAKIGDTLRIRKPNKYTVRSGRVMNVQNTTNDYVSLPVTSQKGVDMNFTSVERSLSLDDFSKNIIQPAMSVLASYIDNDALSMINKVYNSVGTPGTTPASTNVFSDAMAKLDDNLAPRDGNRWAILTPTAMARTTQGDRALFQASDLLADQYRNGVISKAVGLKWAIDQNLVSVTTGSRSGTVLTVGASSTGATTISLDGLTGATDTIKAGEVFTIADVYDVNPETKATLTTLKQFTVLADATAASNAITNLSISPTIYGPTSGALQNVSALPANDKAITFYGTTSATVYPQNLVFHKDAFTFATADLPLPHAAEQASRQVMDGISMRIWQGDDIVNDQFPCRVDVLYGYVPTYPELACRVWG